MLVFHDDFIIIEPELSFSFVTMDVLISKLYNELENLPSTVVGFVFTSKASQIWLALLMCDLKLPDERASYFELVSMFNLVSQWIFLK